MSRPAVALAALVLLAGCTAPTVQAPATTESALETRTPTTGPDALPVDERRVFDRVADLVASNVSRPSVRTVPASDVAVSYFDRLDPFYRLLLGSEGRGQGSDTPLAYYNPGTNRVTVVLHDGVPANGTDEAGLAVVLAHEYAHAVQSNDPRFRSALDGPQGTSTDARLVYRALVEGGAVFVSDEYAGEYRSSVNATGDMAREYRNGSATTRYARGPYWLGGRYVDRRLRSAANLIGVYRNPPNTTEQVIHNYTPEAEPPADLRVTVDGTDDVAAGSTDTAGEMVVRSLLGARLSESWAADAAAGWGNDRVVTLLNFGANESDQRNFVWALRWDDERNATEFAAALGDYLTARGDRLGDRQWRAAGERFRIDRASGRTVVVVVGGPETVRSVRATADDGNVSVTVTG
jgi:hypothetical protein